MDNTTGNNQVVPRASQMWLQKGMPVEDVVVAELACAVHVKRNAKTSESPLFDKTFLHTLLLHEHNRYCTSIHFEETFVQQTSESVVTRKSKKKLH